MCFFTEVIIPADLYHDTISIQKHLEFVLRSKTKVRMMVDRKRSFDIISEEAYINVRWSILFIDYEWQACYTNKIDETKPVKSANNIGNWFI